jgi:hypothetical protein
MRKKIAVYNKDGCLMLQRIDPERVTPPDRPTLQ